MLRTGGIVTANGLIVYTAYNLEKVLLGRFWGADALGIYGRAYQLINVPNDTLNSAVGGVLMSALSRVKDQPQRLRNYFLTGYSMLIAVTLPITAACALFADDLVFVMLGPQWSEAAPIFRLLAPTILIFGLINPLWPLLVSLGLLMRSFKQALVIAPLVITAYAVGLPWGPKGVALGFSVAMTLWVVPHIAWSLHGTVVSLRDIAKIIARPMLSTFVAAVPAAAVVFMLMQTAPALARIAVGVALLAIVYAGMLMIVMNQRAIYVDALRGLRTRSAS
jgi:PST family polysaccharide transporter